VGRARPLPAFAHRLLAAAIALAFATGNVSLAVDQGDFVSEQFALQILQDSRAAIAQRLARFAIGQSPQAAERILSDAMHKRGATDFYAESWSGGLWTQTSDVWNNYQRHLDTIDASIRQVHEDRRALRRPLAALQIGVANLKHFDDAFEKIANGRITAEADAALIYNLAAASPDTPAGFEHRQRLEQIASDRQASGVSLGVVRPLANHVFFRALPPAQLFLHIGSLEVKDLEGISPRADRRMALQKLQAQLAQAQQAEQAAGLRVANAAPAQSLAEGALQKMRSAVERTALDQYTSLRIADQLRDQNALVASYKAGGKAATDPDYKNAVAKLDRLRSDAQTLVAVAVADPHELDAARVRNATSAGIPATLLRRYVNIVDVDGKARAELEAANAAQIASIQKRNTLEDQLRQAEADNRAATAGPLTRAVRVLADGQLVYSAQWDPVRAPHALELQAIQSAYAAAEKEATAFGELERSAYSTFLGSARTAAVAQRAYSDGLWIGAIGQGSVEAEAQYLDIALGYATGNIPGLAVEVGKAAINAVRAKSDRYVIDDAGIADAFRQGLTTSPNYRTSPGASAYASSSAALKAAVVDPIVEAARNALLEPITLPQQLAQAIPDPHTFATIQDAFVADLKQSIRPSADILAGGFVLNLTKEYAQAKLNAAFRQRIEGLLVDYLVADADAQVDFLAFQRMQANLRRAQVVRDTLKGLKENLERELVTTSGAYAVGTDDYFRDPARLTFEVDSQPAPSSPHVIYLNNTKVRYAQGVYSFSIARPWTGPKDLPVRVIGQRARR